MMFMRQNNETQSQHSACGTFLINLCTLLKNPNIFLFSFCRERKIWTIRKRDKWEETLRLGPKGHSVGQTGRRVCSQKTNHQSHCDRTNLLPWLPKCQKPAEKKRVKVVATVSSPLQQGQCRSAQIRSLKTHKLFYEPGLILMQLYSNLNFYYKEEFNTHPVI